MKLGIINCPNTPRLIKCTCFFLGTLLTLTLIGLNRDPYNAYTIDRLYAGYISRLTSKRSVCVGFIGRLGNQMFQYASAFGIAKMKNMTVRVGKMNSVAKYFQLSATIYNTNHYCDHAERVYERQSCAFDPDLFNISSKKDTLLLDYLQSWMYFKHTTKQLRKEFSFKDNIIDKARTVFNNVTGRVDKRQKQNTTYIGLHIRRGDMVYGSNNTQKQYNTAGVKYIMRAINFYLAKYPDATFVVCSDDINWAKKKLQKYEKILNLVFTDKNPGHIDLAILSLCDHMIMTTGTFGWWAGWLTGGTVVYYKNYIKEDSQLRNEFSNDYYDYYYPGWIAME